MALIPGRLPDYRPPKFKRRDCVKFVSTSRPDLLPQNVRPYGEVVIAGALGGVTVRFYDLPDETIYVGEHELIMATGLEHLSATSVQKKKKKKYVTLAEKEKWKEW